MRDILGNDSLPKLDKEVKKTKLRNRSVQSATQQEIQSNNLSFSTDQIFKIQIESRKT